jgi:hypothetical protein
MAPLMEADMGRVRPVRDSTLVFPVLYDHQKGVVAMTLLVYLCVVLFQIPPFCLLCSMGTWGSGIVAVVLSLKGIAFTDIVSGIYADQDHLVILHFGSSHFQY